MFVVFENSNDRSGPPYFGTLLTDLNGKNPPYIDVMDCKDIKHQKPDWKNSHINSVSFEDIKCFADDYKTIRREFSEYLF